MYYATMQITFLTRNFRNGERNLHCDVVHITTKWVSSLTLDRNGVFAIKAYSSNDSSAEVQGAAVTYYVPSWAAPCPICICSLNLEQSRVDSCTAQSTLRLRPQIAMVWSNCLLIL